MRKLPLLLTFALLTLTTAIASAQSIPDVSDLPTGRRPNSIHVWGAFAAGENPIVFGAQIKPYLKMPWGEGKTLLTSDSHWRLGGHFTLSPAYSRTAILIGVSPLLICDLDLHYGPGFNTYHVAYDSFDDEYDPLDLGESEDYVGIYHQATANLTLKAAVGPIAMLGMNDADYLHSDEYHFNWDNATIVKTGWVVRSKTFLLYEFVKDWRAFVDYEYLQYFDNEFETHLLGAGIFVANQIFGDYSWLLQAGYHLDHPKFEGIKIWTVFMREWDFPLARKLN